MSFNEWKETTLDKIYDFSSGLSKGSKEFGFGSPFLSFKTVFYNYFIPEEIVDLANTNENEQEKCSVKKGDVFLTRTSETFDELGMSSVALKDYPKATFNGFTKRLRPKNMDIINPLFAGYFFRSSKFRNSVSSMASMTTRASLNNDMLSRLPIMIPPVAEQEGIANCLYSLDQKIKLNNRINKTQEEMAQAIFKQWFVDFDFPDENGQSYKSSGGEMEESELGLIPRGWKMYKLGELVDSVSITYKFGSDKIIFLNTSDISEGRVLHHKFSPVEGLPGQAKKSIKKLDILFSEIRPANKRFAFIDFDSENYVVSTKLMVLRKKSHIHPIVVYSFLTSQETLGVLQQLAESRSGTFPQITYNQVKDLRIAFPESDLLDTYTEYAWSVFKMVSNLNKQTQALEQLRDSLLPKLMSGEIRVPIEEVPQSV